MCYKLTHHPGNYWSVSHWPRGLSDIYVRRVRHRPRLGNSQSDAAVKLVVGMLNRIALTIRSATASSLIQDRFLLFCDCRAKGTSSPIRAQISRSLGAFGTCCISPYEGRCAGNHLCCCHGNVVCGLTLSNIHIAINE